MNNTTPRVPLQLTDDTADKVLNNMDQAHFKLRLAEADPGTHTRADAKRLPRVIPKNIVKVVRHDPETKAMKASVAMTLPLLMARILLFAGVSPIHPLFTQPLTPQEFWEAATPLLLSGLECLGDVGLLQNQPATTLELLMDQTIAEHAALIRQIAPPAN